jgi:hypothetical protein
MQRPGARAPPRPPQRAGRPRTETLTRASVEIEWRADPSAVWPSTKISSSTSSVGCMSGPGLESLGRAIFYAPKR